MHSSDHISKTTRATALLLAALTAATGFTPLTAQTASSGDDLAALREQIRQLDQKIRILERNQELKEEKAAADAKKLPAVSLSAKGFSVATADKAFTLKAGILAQADARFYLDGDAGTSNDGFILRRIRTPFSGTIFKTFNFNITPEFAANDTAGSNTQLVDAWIDARITPGFNLKVGKFRTPVALEGPDPRHFIEAAYTNQLATNRDLGIEAFGSFADGIIAYRAGIFNGAVNNTWNSSTNDNDGSFTFAGRLSVTPFQKSEGALSGLTASLGGAVGSQEKTNANAIRSNGQQSIVSGFNTDGTHTTLAPAIEFYTGSFGAQAEFTWDRHERGAASTVSNKGWRINAGYVLTGEESTARGVNPKNPFSIENGTWGAFEVVARVSGLDVDSDLASIGTNVDKVFSYGAGLNWYLNDNIQARFDVEKSNFSGTTLENELYFFSRLQLKF